MKTILLTILLLSSCAHYSIHPASNHVTYVPPITLEGEYDIDGSSLARTMVARLEYLGHRAKYGGNQNQENLLLCHVVTNPINTSAALSFVQLRLRCNIRGESFSQAIAESATSMGTQPIHYTHPLLQNAAIDAVENIAFPISKYLISTGKK